MSVVAASTALRKLAADLLADHPDGAPGHVVAMAQVWERAAVVADRSMAMADTKDALVDLYGTVAEHAMACIDSRKEAP